LDHTAKRRSRKGRKTDFLIKWTGKNPKRREKEDFEEEW
jgi:hypothetical protein